MEAFSEAIKVFAEKHLVPSIISLVSGAGIYLITPDDCWVIEKITKLGYWLLVSGCVFIITYLEYRLLRGGIVVNKVQIEAICIPSMLQ